MNINKTPITLTTAICFATLMTACGGSGDVSSSSEQPDNSFNSPLSVQYGTATARDENPQSDEATQNQVVNGFNNLSLQVLREQTEKEPGKNTINSGYSLAIALSMLQRGTANNDLNFVQQILGVSAIEENNFYQAINALDLELESRSNDELDLRIANQLFVKPDYPLETEFLDVMTTQFDAPIEEAQFATAPEDVRNAINQWASDNTNELIPELLADPLSTDTVMAILNATLLDAAWSNEFRDIPNFTFTAADGSEQIVPGFGGTSNFKYHSSKDAYSISLPYNGNTISLMIIVPENIDSYTASLTPDMISQQFSESESKYINFSAPNWKISSDIDFTSLPVTSGLVKRNLDMTRLTTDPLCCDIGEFKQKALIEVDKDGTRAAAVTIIGITIESVQQSQAVSIDQPFLFFIRDEPTGLILFSGRVLAHE